MEPDLERRIRAAARRLRDQGAMRVYVFGSALDGTLREDSDVDLAVEGLPAHLFFQAMAEASWIVGRPVDLVEVDRDGQAAGGISLAAELKRVG